MVPRPSSEWVAAVNAAASIDTVCMKVSDVFGLGYKPQGAAPPHEIEAYRAHLDVLWNAFGPQRLIYGSNWPVCDRVGDPQQVYGEQLAILRCVFSCVLRRASVVICGFSCRLQSVFRGERRRCD